MLLAIASLAGLFIAGGAASASDQPRALAESARATACTPRPGKKCPTRLWYRVRAEIRGTFFSIPEDLIAYNEITITNRWQIRSNTAVLVYLQCAVVGNPLPPQKMLAVTGLLKGPCAEVEQAVTGVLTAPEAEKLRRALVDDIRFTANGKGSFDAFRDHRIAHATYFRPDGSAFVCGPFVRWTLVLTSPLKTTGELTTESAVETGIALRLGRKSDLTYGLFHIPAYECRDGDVVRGQQPGFAQTGPGPGLRQNALNAPILVGTTSRGGGRDGFDFGGPLVPASVKLRNLLPKFGSSFNVSGRQVFANVLQGIKGTTITEKKTVRYTLRFTLCPKGGLSAKSC